MRTNWIARHDRKTHSAHVWEFFEWLAAIELARVVVLHAGRDVRENSVAITDRQAWPIAVLEWHMQRLSVALSAARRARRAHGVELAGRGNFVSQGSAENSEGSDKWERLGGNRELTVPIRNGG